MRTVSSLLLLREVDLRSNAVLRVALEVLVPIVEACHVRPDAVGKLTDVHVVIFERLVVTLPLDCDTIFCSGSLIRQARELLVTLQIGILLLKAKERP